MIEANGRVIFGEMAAGPNNDVFIGDEDTADASESSLATDVAPHWLLAAISGRRAPQPPAAELGSPSLSPSPGAADNTSPTEEN